MTMRVCLFLVCTLLLTSGTFAQEIEAKLSGSKSGQGFTVKNNSSTTLFTVRGDGDVGIGTATPELKLTLRGDGGILATGAFNSGTTLTTSGMGTRLLWYPRKAAFRAGTVAGSEWDESNIGSRSVAMGLETVASGSVSTAIGLGCIASGGTSAAFGYETEASGDYATSIGHSTAATGTRSTAMGWSTTASGSYATAMGSHGTASGTCAITMGSYTTASGDYSLATGHHTTASGASSTAMGSYVSTNNKKGAFIIGDNSASFTRDAITDNHFTARFAMGYALFTNSACSIGVALNPSSNSWGSISDSTRKERFLEADGDAILREFRSLRLGSWNYKDQDATQYRHYGPMAQEWFAAFGRDGIGTIGDDTTLASADVDGVLCIAVKALEQRTATLQVQMERISVLETALREKNERISALEEEVRSLRTESEGLRCLQADVQRLRSAVSDLSDLRSAVEELRAQRGGQHRIHNAVSEHRDAIASPTHVATIPRQR